MKFLREGLLLLGMALTACQAPDRGTEPGNGPQSDEAVFQDNSNDWIILHEGRKIPGNALAKSAYTVNPRKWYKTNLTYRLNGTWTTRDKTIANEAFNAIGSVIPLTFQLVSAETPSDIEISLVDASTLPAGASGETTSSTMSTSPDIIEYTHARIELAYTGNTNLDTRYNEMMNTMMHEICHAVGMGHSQYVKAMMYYGYYRTGEVPELYFMTPDDIQGLQSIYGSVTPKYPSWDHRYNVGIMVYVKYVPAPGAPPIGWVQSSTFPLWTKFAEPEMSRDLNNEVYRVTVKK